MGDSLTKEEQNLLKTVLEKRAPRLLEKVDLLEQGLLDKDTVNEMRIAIGGEFGGCGLGPGYEPNEYGYRLEALGSKLADLYIWPNK